jgi:hypothetical protein
MPQPNSAGIDVSKEEEKYLRRAFRRFALPYVIGFAMVAWATTMLVAKDAPTGSGAELSSLQEKVTTLETSIAALEGRVAKMGGDLERAGTRVGALESRKPTAPRADETDTSGLERSLRDATRRIAELEKRGGGSGSGPSAAERIDALVVRMQRIEGMARSSAAPPAPGAPAPAPLPAAPAPAPTP